MNVCFIHFKIPLQKNINIKYSVVLKLNITANFTGTHLLYFCEMFATCFARQTLRHWHLNNKSAPAALWFYLWSVGN